MAVEVWYRNPEYYIRECLEDGRNRFAWDRGYLHKKRIDVAKFMSLYFGTQPWEALVIGDEKQGAQRIDAAHPIEAPLSSHPVWAWGSDWTLLEELVESSGRVIVADLPPVHQGPVRRFINELADLQEEHPDCLIHVHGLYSYRVQFGLGFRSTDVDPRAAAAKGRVTIPPGKNMTYEAASELPHWITSLGMQPVELKVPRNRCIYNMRSAEWAARYYRDTVKFKTKGRNVVDPDTLAFQPATDHAIMVKRLPVTDGDKFLCDTCSLQLTCKYFRTGAVCIVPQSEPVELAKFFKTRDSEQIIDGLGTLLATQTRRLERAMEHELAEDTVDPQVTKIINTLFDRGVKLAKLVNPALAAAGAPQTKVNVGIINGATPQAMAAAVVEQLTQRGIPLEEITPDMIEKVISQPAHEQPRAIEAVAREVSA